MKPREWRPMQICRKRRWEEFYCTYKWPHSWNETFVSRSICCLYSDDTHSVHSKSTNSPVCLTHSVQCY
ncbi:hypothetical protein SRHO_G00161780 [Serrasalmus rhombeus]